jgi:predicted regulator of amino acid metabolism with ACT domain
VDQPIPEAVLQAVAELDGVHRVGMLEFVS